MLYIRVSLPIRQDYRLTTNCVAKKDAGENNCSALRHSSVLLPYYLAPIDIPYLITHQVLPRNYGYVIRREAIIRRYLFASITFLYQIATFLSRKISQKSDNFFALLVGQTERNRPKRVFWPY